MSYIQGKELKKENYVNFIVNCATTNGYKEVGYVYGY